MDERERSLVRESRLWLEMCREEVEEVEEGVEECVRGKTFCCCFPVL